jgi:hypothetical protein
MLLFTIISKIILIFIFYYLLKTRIKSILLINIFHSSDENYEKDNGWLELLYPILTLNLSKNENYNFFNAILRRYIPK